MEIKNASDVDQLDSIFKKHGKIHEHCTLGNNLSEEDLFLMIDRKSKSPFFAELVELIVHHEQVTPRLFELIYQIAPHDSETGNSLANCRKCPVHILNELVKSPARSVADHAKINLLANTIKQTSASKLLNLVKLHSGDSAIDLGIRSTIAGSIETPQEVLLYLVDDDVDFIAEMARKRQI